MSLVCVIYCACCSFFFRRLGVFSEHGVCLYVGRIKLFQLDVISNLEHTRTHTRIASLELPAMPLGRATLRSAGGGLSVIKSTAVIALYCFYAQTLKNFKLCSNSVNIDHFTVDDIVRRFSWWPWLGELRICGLYVDCGSYVAGLGGRRPHQGLLPTFPQGLLRWGSRDRQHDARRSETTRFVIVRISLTEEWSGLRRAQFWAICTSQETGWQCGKIVSEVTYNVSSHTLLNPTHLYFFSWSPAYVVDLLVLTG